MKTHRWFRFGPRKPFVRNHYLPSWLHRLCNALFGSVLLTTGLFMLWPNLLVLWIGPATFVGLLLLSPNKFSCVEGVAGGDGYADLDEPSPIDSRANRP